MWLLRVLVGGAVALIVSACGAAPRETPGWQLRQMADERTGNVSEQAQIDLPVTNGHAQLVAQCLKQDQGRAQNQIFGSDRAIEVEITFLTDNASELRVGPTRVTGGVKTVSLRASMAAGQAMDIGATVDRANAVKFDVDASLLATPNPPSALRVEAPLLFRRGARNEEPISYMQVIDLAPQDANLRALFNHCNEQRVTQTPAATH